MIDRTRLLRAHTDDGHAKVTFAELFFDLVFVFAVTQLSHLLLHALNPGGAAPTLLLLLAVWWVWIFTSWATNWLDPERTAVRLMLFGLMIAGVILAASIPKAFDERGSGSRGLMSPCSSAARCSRSGQCVGTAPTISAISSA